VPPERRIAYCNGLGVGFMISAQIGTLAGYGTLANWAKHLGLDEDQKTLHDILEQEKKTDEKLTKLAKQVINPEAAG
jgi:ferritin-like metal-binding protein YciE